jgi:hypothetical protein
MFIFIAKLEHLSDTIECVVRTDNNLVLVRWQPRKYPNSARLQAIIRGKDLPRDEYNTLIALVPHVLKQQFAGKSVEEQKALLGASIHVDTNDTEFTGPTEEAF